MKFASEEARQCQSLYEGQTIGETILAHLGAAGIDVRPDGDADFTVIVHAAHRQGDHIQLTGHADLRQIDTNAAVRSTLKLLEETPGPCVLIDVAYANGSDPALIEELLKRSDLLDNCFRMQGGTPQAIRRVLRFH